jgi:Ferritin-like
MPELIPVTGLSSADQAIETIVEEGEGARGSWQGAHFGRFLTMLEEHRALAADDPSFAPARRPWPTRMSGCRGTCWAWPPRAGRPTPTIPSWFTSEVVPDFVELEVAVPA